MANFSIYLMKQGVYVMGVNFDSQCSVGSVVIVLVFVRFIITTCIALVLLIYTCSGVCGCIPLFLQDLFLYML